MLRKSDRSRGFICRGLAGAGPVSFDPKHHRTFSEIVAANHVRLWCERPSITKEAVGRGGIRLLAGLVQAQSTLQRRTYFGFAGTKGTKPSRFGMRTFGSVWAFIVSLSLMMPLSCRI